MNFFGEFIYVRAYTYDKIRIETVTYIFKFVNKIGNIFFFAVADIQKAV